LARRVDQTAPESGAARIARPQIEHAAIAFVRMPGSSSLAASGARGRDPLRRGP